MKVYTDKQLATLIRSTRNKVFKDIDANRPKDTNVLDKIVAEQLERYAKDIAEWRSSVSEAEDITNPDRQRLMEMYRDFMDDAQLWSVYQNRQSKAVNGGIKIVNDEGDEDDTYRRLFVDPFGFPLQWFRNFMKYVVDANFYGWEAIQLGDVVNGIFKYTKKIPEENQIPYYDAMITDVNRTYMDGSSDSIQFAEEPQNTWVVRTGSKTDLGLINKCAPYIIWKSVFGSWAQHANIFGMPLRIGKTDMQDPARKQNMIDALKNQEGAAWIVQDLMDEMDSIEQKGSGDPHNIYGGLIEKCDQAISKIVLSQTGTTDEKAWGGSAGVHENVESQVILNDKLTLMSVINNELIPRMKRIGIIPTEAQVYIGFDYSEELSIKEWAEVISMLSMSGYVVPADEVSKRIPIELDKQVVAVPENKTFSIMNMYKKMIQKDGTHNS